MSSFTVERNNYRRKLISLVKQHPILWDKNLENYNRNRPQKFVAWDEIGKQLEVDSDTLRRTWENLRDQYRRDLKREVTYGFKSKWRFFNEMDFMREMIAPSTHESKANHDFTDSDTEIEGNNDNNQSQSNHNELLSPPEINSNLSSANPSLTLAPAPNIIAQATNILPFQPIVLTRQWQPTASEISQQYNPLAAAVPQFTPEVPNLQPMPNPSEFQNNCDSSNEDLKHSINITNSDFVEITKQEEPDFEGSIIEDPQPKAAAANASPNPNLRNFQEDRVSTSSHKRSRMSLEEINECPTNASTSSTQKPNEADLEVRDDDYYFLMSLLPSLRQIPRKRKFPVRLDIMKVIAKDLERVE